MLKEVRFEKYLKGDEIEERLMLRRSCSLYRGLEKKDHSPECRYICKEKTDCLERLGHCIKRCGRDSNWDTASRDVKEIVTGTFRQEMR